MLFPSPLFAGAAAGQFARVDNAARPAKSGSGRNSFFDNFNSWISGVGTRLSSMNLIETARASFHGWFLAGRFDIFQAERKKLLGTVALSPIYPCVGAGFHGWFPAPHMESFSKNQNAGDSDYRPEHGSPYHQPILTKEIKMLGEATDGDFFVDATLGGGGHSELFLTAGAEVLGIDQDSDAIAAARQRLSRFGKRFHSWQGNYSDMDQAPQLAAGRLADGILLDLGVSSHQLDTPERGFSFQAEGPLDMRMNPTAPLTAAELVNTSSEENLVQILRDYGEERQARRIARAIIEFRKTKQFSTTTELAECIAKVIGRRGRTHPATRSFQAIRIAVNEELTHLRQALEKIPSLLRPGGRLLVITFHSLEDRIVKHFLREYSQAWIDRPEWPEPRRNPKCIFKLPQRKAITASAEEIQHNPRARSAKLRVASRITPHLKKP